VVPRPADASYQNIYSIGSERSKFVFILSGITSKMNYSRMLKQHSDSAASHRRDYRNSHPPGGETVRVIETDKIGASWASRKKLPSQGVAAPRGALQSSMGIYIFNTQLLIPSFRGLRGSKSATILARTFFRVSFRSTASFAIIRR